MIGSPSIRSGIGLRAIRLRQSVADGEQDRDPGVRRR